MKVEEFVKILGSEFYCGVPDSQLKSLCDYLMNLYGENPLHHIIAANEGNCVGIAAGYHLSTGKIPVVYMQNSGQGNIINPLASLLNENVYAIPVIFVIGWRGEAGIKDEPQHIYQGQVTIKLLEDMGVERYIISQGTTEKELQAVMQQYQLFLREGKSIAFVVRKNAITYEKEKQYKNKYELPREKVLEHIVKISGNDLIVATTGKTSRELFEIREKFGGNHANDFLTVGAMGHNSSIALGIALQKQSQKIWCLDGDGAAIMHMGALGVIASCAPKNMIHIVINNEAHESVGGMPTVSNTMNFAGIAKNCGYPYAVTVKHLEELDYHLNRAKEINSLYFIEVKCAVGSRKDLGRPTTNPRENKRKFMEHVKKLF